MAAAKADAHVAALNERLFLDDDGKDATFELADGIERAHKVLLSAASDVFKMMFHHDMDEKTTGVVKLPDISKTTMRTFLRLVYTGCVDVSDWGGAETAPEEEQLVLKQMNVQVQGRRLTSLGDDDNSVALLAGGSTRDFEFAVCAEDWVDMSSTAFGIAPLGSALQQHFETHHGFFGCVDDGVLFGLLAQDGTDKGLDELLILNGRDELSVKFQHGVLHFAVNGDDVVAARFKTPIPIGINYAPAVCFEKSGDTVEIVRVTSASEGQCPLDVLVGVALLAKKYMIPSVLDICTDAMKERLAAAKQRKDVDTFEKILVSAISGDLFSVRMAARDAAKEGFPELRGKRDTGDLHPLALHDLSDVWPLPATKRRKIRNLL